MIAMETSRRFMLGAMAGFCAAPQAAAAFGSGVDAGEMTVAEERYARLIAAAHAPTIGAARAERYANMHWRDYVAAARAVLDARG
jgi:hypothetical protein